MKWLYWAHTYEKIAFERYGFRHPDEFWTLTFREFRMVAEGIRKAQRQQLETYAHFTRILIGQFPFRGKAKPPSIAQMIGPSDEEKAEMRQRAREIKRKVAEKRERAKLKGRVDIS